MLSPIFTRDLKYAQSKWIYGTRIVYALAEHLNPLPNSSIIDLGSGFGKTALHLARKYRCNVIGVEFSSLLVKQAETKTSEEHMEKKVRFTSTDSASPKLPEGTFDSALVESALSFTKEKQELTTLLSSAVRKGGRIAILELTYAYPSNADESNAALKHFFGVEAEFLHAESWMRIFEQHNLKVLETSTHRLSLTRKFLDDVRGDGVGAIAALVKTLCTAATNPVAGSLTQGYLEFFKKFGKQLVVSTFICENSGN